MPVLPPGSPGVDRWTEAKWRDLEDQVGPAPDEGGGPRPEDETTHLTAGMLARAPSATGKRRSDWLAVDKGWLK